MREAYIVCGADIIAYSYIIRDLRERISLKKALLSKCFFMVEMARFELASENLFPKLSTSVVYLLKFPWGNADKQALTLGSPLNP